MEQTDRRLVERVREGDREAFGDLVDRYRDMVYGLGYHLTHDFEAARDLAQEAFVQAYLKLGQLRDPERFSGWLRRIATNVHRNQLERREVATVALEDAGEVPDTRRPSEIEVVVREALAKLREPERLALTLHYVNGYSHADIGGFLGVRPETVKTRLARARQHLKTEVMAMVEDSFGEHKLPEEFTKETVEAAVERANALMQDGKFGEAYWAYRNLIKPSGFGPTIQGCETILRERPRYVPALIGLGFAKWQAGELEEALTLFHQVLEREPGNGMATIAIEQLLATTRRHDELDAFREERQKSQPRPAAHYHADRASDFLGMGRPDEAERELRLALAAEPHEAQQAARVMLAKILVARGDFAAAAPLMATAISAASGQMEASYYRWQIAISHYHAGKYGEAIEALRAILMSEDLNRENLVPEGTLFLLERCHFETGRLDAFADFCRDLIPQMPDRELADRARWYLALFLESRMLAGEALAEFERLGAIPAKCWRVVLPFGGGHGANMAAVYPPEEGVDLSATYVGKLGSKLRWERPYSEGAGVQLDLYAHAAVSAVGSIAAAWGVGYGYMQVISPRARDAVLRFGASGSVQVWVNRDSVFAGSSATGAPDMHAAPMRLKRGRNEVLVKLGAQEGDTRNPRLRGANYLWSLFSRITDKDGEPLRELTFPLEQ